MLLAITLLLRALWATTASNRALLKPDVTEEEIAAIAAEGAPNIGFYVAATILALFAPRIAARCYLVIAVVAVVRARGDEPAASASASA